MINDYVYEALSFRSSPLYSDVKDAAMDLTVTSLEVLLSFHFPPNNYSFPENLGRLNIMQSVPVVDFKGPVGYAVD